VREATTQETDLTMSNATVDTSWAMPERDLAWIDGRRTWATRGLLRSVIFNYVERCHESQWTRYGWATVLLRATKRPQWLSQT
jgi:hypothetical protein